MVRMKPPRKPDPTPMVSLERSGGGKRYPDRGRPSPVSPIQSPSSAVPFSSSDASQSGSTPTSRPSMLTTLLPKEDLTPRDWTECFDHCTDIPLASRKGVWRVYDAGLSVRCDLALVLLHGGGHCGLSWGLVAEKLKGHVPVVAFDARGHGNSQSENDADLSSESQVADAAALISSFFEQRLPGQTMPRLVICGHSMGGAIAVRLSAARLLPHVVGLIVIDVVEGTAMSALPYMTRWLQGRPTSFKDRESGIRYVVKAGHVRNIASARLSVPPQLTFLEEVGKWVWRTDLERSERHWKGWFGGLSSLFLSVAAAKLLVLANVDRLDKDLMIAQMQGKFQNILIPAAGHTVHEDQPDQTAQVILEYLQRNMFLSSSDGSGLAIFQQRDPIPPCL